MFIADKVKKKQPPRLTTESFNDDPDNSVLKVVEKQNDSIYPAIDNDSWKGILLSHKIDHSKTYDQQPTCIEIVNRNGDVSKFGSLGNFSVFIGKAKSRKTFSISMFLAAAIKKDSSTDFIRSTLPEGKTKAAAFDTEQSEFDVSIAYSKRIQNLIQENNPGNFEAFTLRSLTPAERLFLIEKYIYETDDLGIVVIDGIRDLISDINSPEEATMISSKLLKWTQERNIHIITVIHQNKGDNNARGHVGTELINKAESVISVEKDGEVSVVKPEFIRGKDFEPFAFSVNTQGIPYILEDWTPGANDQKKAVNVLSFETDIHKKMIRAVFNKNKNLKYSDLVSELKIELEENSIVVGLNKVKDFLMTSSRKTGHL